MNIAIITLSGVILILLFFFVYLTLSFSRERDKWAVERKDLYDRLMCPTIHDYDAHKQAESKPDVVAEADDELGDILEVFDTSPTDELLDLQPEAEAEIRSFMRS